MSSSTLPKLFQPIKVGDLTLAHRVVLAPLTRFRGTKFEHVPLPNVKEYYRQRGSTPGTLLITEATFISPQAGGYTNVPGIWSDEQISKWKEVTDTVHAEGSFIYLQLWALGRAAVAAELKAEDPSFDYVAPSAIKLTGHDETPRALTIPEIKQYVQWYATAAKNAVERAGFDGVEIHGANGYLIDQFLQDVSNHRTDEYGGSIENRSRFGLEVVDAVVKAVGASKTGIRLSPWGKFQDMRMADPLPQFSYFATELKTRHPDLAYLHLVEPRAQGFAILRDEDLEARESNDFLRKIWAPKPLITAGAYTRELAIKTAEEKGDIIAVGRYFISNPDLPLRWRHNLPLTEYNRDTFYLKGDASPTGYTDYPFAEKTAEQSKL
ncbi:NADH:flavin oxidoreductase/NADH oxidase [Schizophyllum commune Tattone D]|nr:NADH:flavin oxidoreductase/NADH oxidase [Schizophyllum commune Tattone D]